MIPSLELGLIITVSTMLVHLRCLTSIELYSNASFYTSHPLIKERHKKGVFFSKVNAFAMCLLDAVIDSIEAHNPESAVFSDAKKQYQKSCFFFIPLYFGIVKYTKNAQLNCITQSLMQLENVLQLKWVLCQLCLIAPYIEGNSLNSIQIICILSNSKNTSVKKSLCTLCKPVPSSPDQNNLTTRLPHLDFTLKSGEWKKETTSEKICTTQNNC